MYASALFHKKKGHKKSKKRAKAGGGDGNACCPIIRVKCKRRFAKIENAPKSLQARLKAYKAAKPGIDRAKAAYTRAQAAFQKATGLGGIGPTHPLHENTSLPAREVAKAVHNPVMHCSVTMGTRRFKGLTGEQAQAKVVELSRGLAAKRCIPTVKRGA